METKRRIDQSKNELVVLRHEIETTKAKLSQLKQEAAQKFHFVPVSHPPIPMENEAVNFYNDDTGSGSGINNNDASQSTAYVRGNPQKPD